MIHKTAIIDLKAEISSNVKIGPYSVVGPNVKIDENSEIQSHVSIVGNTKIGKNNKIYPFSSIGNDPQDLKFNGEDTKLEIGDNNKIREYVTINPGTNGGGGMTKIGNNCLFMVSSHIAHDCIVGNNVVFVNNAVIGGHVEISDYVYLGGQSAIHQFCRIGTLSMIGGMSAVEHDVVPYGLVTGNRAHLLGLNIVGLRRAKYSNDIIKDFKNTFEKIFNSNEIKTEAISNNDTTNELTKKLIDFIKSDSSRGLCSFKWIKKLIT